jgi:hypothetical protein
MKTSNLVNTATSKARFTWRYLMLMAAVAVTSATQPIYAGDAVPFKGRAEGAIVSSTPAPGGVLLRTLASGQATLLGEFTREETLVLNPATGAIIGTLVFTAANGDQLLGSIAAQFTSPTTVLGTLTITGGTGRFQDATGEAAAIVSTADGVHFTVEFDGSVSSVGGNK